MNKSFMTPYVSDADCALVSLFAFCNVINFGARLSCVGVYVNSMLSTF